MYITECLATTRRRFAGSDQGIKKAELARRLDKARLEVFESLAYGDHR
ncbi:hypothetical protein [Acidithiobacillus sp.]|nr:hypothetical protein [Acidithiobacillus sp.]MDD5280407.1 hypothetical protein [Acidithiobacillus sp.]